MALVLCRLSDVLLYKTSPKSFKSATLGLKHGSYMPVYAVMHAPRFVSRGHQAPGYPALAGLTMPSVCIFRVSAGLRSCGAVLPNRSEKIPDIQWGIVSTVRTYMHAYLGVSSASGRARQLVARAISAANRHTPCANLPTVFELVQIL